MNGADECGMNGADECGWCQAVRSRAESESRCHERQYLEGLMSQGKNQGLERVCEEKFLKCLEDKEVHDRCQWSTMNLLVSNLRGRFWDFPGGPVVKILPFHYRGQGFGPWSGPWSGN